jgi:predicted nucleic acid-binding protein
LLSFLQKEKNYSLIEDVVLNAIENQTPMFIQSVNMGEVWYIIARKLGEKKADEIVESLVEMGIQVIDTAWPITQKAAQFKLLGGISYADCFAASLTFHKQAQLLTGAKEFERVQHAVEIIWLSR